MRMSSCVFLLPFLPTMQSGLPGHVAADDVQALFQQFGPIHRVHLVMDHAAGVCRGFAFVRFLDFESAFRALEHEGPPLSLPDGSILSVRYEDTRSDLYVCKIPSRMNETDVIYSLESALPPQIRVSRFSLCRAPDGASKGFGWASFEDIELAKAAVGILKQRASLDLHVEIAESKAPKDLRVLKDCKSVFVKHVPADMDEPTFRSLFHGQCLVDRVDFVPYSRADISRYPPFKLAYVTFASQRDAVVGIELLNQTYVGGLFFMAEWMRTDLAEKTGRPDRSDPSASAASTAIHRSSTSAKSATAFDDPARSEYSKCVRSNGVRIFDVYFQPFAPTYRPAR